MRWWADRTPRRYGGTPPADPPAGGWRLVRRVFCQSCPSSPKARRAARPSSSRGPRANLAGSGAAPAPVDGFPKGERSLPCGRSRCRNTGRGAGRESPARGSQGARIALCSMGFRGERKSPRSRGSSRREMRNDKSLRSAGKGSMPGRLIQPLSKRVVKRRVSLGVALGVDGGWEIPPQGARGTVVPRTPCTNHCRFSVPILRL